MYKIAYEIIDSNLETGVKNNLQYSNETFLLYGVIVKFYLLYRHLKFSFFIFPFSAFILAFLFGVIVASFAFSA